MGNCLLSGTDLLFSSALVGKRRSSTETGGDFTRRRTRSTLGIYCDTVTLAMCFPFVGKICFIFTDKGLLPASNGISRLISESTDISDNWHFGWWICNDVVLICFRVIHIKTGIGIGFNTALTFNPNVKLIC